MAQRVVQYQAVLQMAQQAPQIYDLPQLHRQMIDVLGIKNADKLVPIEDDEKPVDPISENMNALNVKPLKAFIYQDHDAHIAAHTSFMQDPKMAQMIGQNPQANQIMSALQAHIAEHLGFSYRKQIEDKLGVPLPAPNEELPEEIELQLSRLIATAATQLTQQNQQEAAQQQAQQQAQDPVMQMKQAEMQLKTQEEQRKMQKDQADIQIRQAELQLKTQQVQSELATGAQKDVANMQIRQAELELKAQQIQNAKTIDTNKLELDKKELQLDTTVELSKVELAEQKMQIENEMKTQTEILKLRGGGDRNPPRGE